MTYETVIGLEIHVQLATASKAFCGCSTQFGAAPNSQTCPVCLGLPGSLPVYNQQALQYGMQAGLALNCTIGHFIKFDRKNYYYPDLPKNFQISQFDKPLATSGYLDIECDGARKKIGITRAHLEEDAGKLIHAECAAESYVDYNRVGTPLLEIVSEPDLRSPEEAYVFLTALKAILQYIEVSDCNMEEGSLRCDANISLRPVGREVFGEKVELKNMNSFKAVRLGLQYEVARQAKAYDKGEAVVQETRLWDEAKGVTRSMRTKEESHDYRYFPEPDLPPFIISANMVNTVRASLPELPAARRARLQSEYALNEYDAGVLTQDKRLADYFEACCAAYAKPKPVANWIMGDMLAHLNANSKGIADVVMQPAQLGELLKMIDDGVINAKSGKEILFEMIETGASPKELVEKKGCAQISDAAELEAVVAEVIAANQSSADDYVGGKDNALMFLVGQVMKQTRGKANPHMVNELLRKKLDALKDS